MSNKRLFTSGLVVLGLLSVGDLFAPLLTDGKTPPMLVALVLSALGLVSVFAFFPAWKGSRPALVTLLVVRGLSALSAVPAFVVPDVPPAAKIAAAAAIGLYLAGTAMVLNGRPVAAKVR